jgi:carboxypeptidase PM20D1
MPSRQLRVEPVEVTGIDDHAVASALKEMLAEPSISDRDRSKIDPEPFRSIHSILRERFPRVQEALDCTTVNELSLLYHWPGQDSSLEPILLMSHLDVVPIESESIDQWTDKKAEARIDEDYVWGRGALDVKCGVVGILSAVEQLLAEGFQPQRTVYLALGHDEEVGGKFGNGAIAQQFEASGMQFAFVLDEGGAILQDIIPGVKQPVAFVGIAEKRCVELTITARGEGGHGSIPGRSAVLNLTECIRRMDQQPMPARMTDAAATLFDFLGPEMPLPQRTVAGNRSLFAPLLTYQLARSPSTNAIVRSTMNVTQISSHSASNQNPTEAFATVNARLLPGDSAETVRDHILRICEDMHTHDPASGRPVPAIGCEITHRSRGELVASTEDDAFGLLQTTIHQVFPDVTVAAGLTSVSTDSAWYYGVTSNVFRFIPMRVSETDVKRIHGIDERIGINNLGDIARFYVQLLRNATTERRLLR